MNQNLLELKMITLKIIYQEETKKINNNLETFNKQKLKY